MNLFTYTPGDIFEGVLVETCKEDGISRPRVRPIDIFNDNIRVEFPVHLREENPLGTRFRVNVKVAQKTKNGCPFGQPYLVGNNHTIEKVESFVPSTVVMPIKLNTASDRSYRYIEDEFRESGENISFLRLRTRALQNISETPRKYRIDSTIIARLDLMKTYALTRANGSCEGCLKTAPFLKKNGEPYLEVHHLVELSKSGSDSPYNIISLCPNCHRQITHGSDGDKYNLDLSERIAIKEAAFDASPNC